MVSTPIRAIEKVLKALANRRRLAILALLRDRPGTPVNEIARGIGLSFAATSRHLRILAAAELVEHEQRGLLVFYNLTRNQPALLKTVLPTL